MSIKAVEVFAAGFIDLANTVVALMIFGQLVVRKKIDPLMIFAGLSFATLMYLIAFLILRG